MQQHVPMDTAAVGSSRTAGDTDLAIPEDAVIAEEVLVEEISIDGMCGVY